MIFDIQFDQIILADLCQKRSTLNAVHKIALVEHDSALAVLRQDIFVSDKLSLQESLNYLGIIEKEDGFFWIQIEIDRGFFHLGFR